VRCNSVFISIFIGLVLLLSGCLRNFSVGIPEFPIPYPKPSAIDILPISVLKRSKSLGDVLVALNKALDNCGYYRKSYFSVPNGFAVVTQLEQINENGTTKPESERWIYHYSRTRIFSVSDYIRALFKAKPGYYRCIAFLVSNEIIYSDSRAPSRDSVYNWLHRGANKLPRGLKKINIDQEYDITALIYEFRRLGNSSQAQLQIPSAFQGRTHLEKSCLLEYLVVDN